MSKCIQDGMKNVLFMLAFLQNIKHPIKKTTHESPIANVIYQAIRNDDS